MVRQPDVGRRTAILTGAGALAAATMPWLAGMAFATRAPAAGDLRTIPSTGQSIPAIGLGSWITFNVGTNPKFLARSVDVVRAFVDEGGGMIDSSPMYGSSQSTIGHALATLGRPASVFCADKVWTGRVAEGPSQIAETGRRWGVDRFDLLQVHNLDAWEGHLETLFAMKAAGRVAAVGVTTSHGRRHDLLEQVMRRHPLDFVQLTYNAVDREVEARLLPLAAERKIGVIVNRPFQGGALVDRLSRTPLPGFAAEVGAETWAELLLKFVLAHPAVTVAIPATTNVAHLRQNKRAARGGVLDAALLRRLTDTIAAA